MESFDKSFSVKKKYTGRALENQVFSGAHADDVLIEHLVIQRLYDVILSRLL